MLHELTSWSTIVTRLGFVATKGHVVRKVELLACEDVEDIRDVLAVRLADLPKSPDLFSVHADRLTAA